MNPSLNVVVIKPSKYLADGFVERFRRGFMPNSTLPYIGSMTPARVGNTPVAVHTIDEYVHTDMLYLSRFRPPQGGRTLLALVGVQSHQFHRALDLAAYARRNGCLAVHRRTPRHDLRYVHDAGDAESASRRRRRN